MNTTIYVTGADQDGPLLWQGGAPAQQLSVVHEMLETLDTLTIAGRRHVMDKVFKFVERRALLAAPHVSERNRAALMELTMKLREESDRMLPDPQIFARSAENLIGLLGALE